MRTGNSVGKSEQLNNNIQTGDRRAGVAPRAGGGSEGPGGAAEDEPGTDTDNPRTTRNSYRPLQMLQPNHRTVVLQTISTTNMPTVS